MLLALAVASVIILSVLVYQHRKLAASVRAAQGTSPRASTAQRRAVTQGRPIPATLYLPTAIAPRDWTKPEAYRELA